MPRNSIEYEGDFYAWTVEQSRLLRAGEFSGIDVVNIAEEIESMGMRAEDLAPRRDMGDLLANGTVSIAGLTEALREIRYAPLGLFSRSTRVTRSSSASAHAKPRIARASRWIADAF